MYSHYNEEDDDRWIPFHGSRSRELKLFSANKREDRSA